MRNKDIYFLLLLLVLECKSPLPVNVRRSPNVTCGRRKKGRGRGQPRPQGFPLKNGWGGKRPWHRLVTCPLVHPKRKALPVPLSSQSPTPLSVIWSLTFCFYFWRARVPQWWERSPPIYVACRVQIPATLRLLFNVSSFLCHEMVSSEHSCFSFSSKNQHFQILIRPRNR